MSDDVEVEAAAEDVFAEEAFGVGVGDGALHDCEEVPVFAAQIDEAHFGLDGEAGDDGAFDDGVGILLEDEAVLAGAGFGFVAVDEDIFRLVGLLGNEGPLEAGGESSAAAATQVRGFHFRDDAVGAEGESFAGGLVTLELEVLVNIGGAFAEAVRDDGDTVGMGGEGRHYFAAPFSDFAR